VSSTRGGALSWSERAVMPAVRPFARVGLWVHTCGPRGRLTGRLACLSDARLDPRTPRLHATAAERSGLARPRGLGPQVARPKRVGAASGGLAFRTHPFGCLPLNSFGLFLHASGHAYNPSHACLCATPRRRASKRSHGRLCAVVRARASKCSRTMWYVSTFVPCR